MVTFAAVLKREILRVPQNGGKRNIHRQKNYAAAHCPFACFHVFALISCCTNACFVILYVICVILNLRDGRTDEQAPGIEFGAFSP